MKKYLPTLVLGALILPLAAQALSLENTGATLTLGTADLKETVLNVVKLVLGLLGLVAVIMIIFSGIIAATSDNEDRAATARKVIVGAVVGLIIVLLAWAIVIFATRTTTNITQ